MTWLDGLVMRFHWQWHPQTSLLAFEFRASDIFTDDEFLSAYVTDLPISVPPPESISGVGEPEIDPFVEVSDSSPPPPAISTSTVASVSCVGALSPNPVVSDAALATTSTTPTHVTVSPEQIKPHPKASERKSTQKRKKGKSQVLTDTPVKMELEKQALMKKTSVRAKTTARASAKAATKANKWLKFTKSSADRDINQGNVCAITSAFRTKKRNEVEANCLTLVICYDMLVTIV